MIFFSSFRLLRLEWRLPVFAIRWRTPCISTQARRHLAPCPLAGCLGDFYSSTVVLHVRLARKRGHPQFSSISVGVLFSNGYLHYFRVALSRPRRANFHKTRQHSCRPWAPRLRPGRTNDVGRCDRRRINRKKAGLELAYPRATLARVSFGCAFVLVGLIGMKWKHELAIGLLGLSASFRLLMARRSH